MTWEKLYEKIKLPSNPFKLSTSEHRNTTRKLVSLIWGAAHKEASNGAGKAPAPGDGEKSAGAGAPAAEAGAGAADAAGTRPCTSCGAPILRSRKRAKCAGGCKKAN
jgi:hypothetical protein